MSLLNLPQINLQQAGTALKNHLKNKLKDKLKKEIGKQVANHFVTFWWVYAILIVLFLFFYMIAAANASGQAIQAKAFVTERFLPPQITVPHLDKIITDGFGERIDPFTHQKGLHTGIDIGLPEGTPISSSQNGIIKKVVYPKFNDPEAAKASGIYVEIESSDPELEGTTRYLHLSNALVVVGQSVRKGQLIGFSGNTGRSTGAHLHYEVIPKDLEPTDPTFYIMMMSQITDVATKEAKKVLDHDIRLSYIGDYDYKTGPMLYISNIYLETEAPAFSEAGTVWIRDLNTGALMPSGVSAGRGSGGDMGPPIIVPTSPGVLHNPFFIRWAPYAMQSEINTGIKASVTLAQMALESGYGGQPICNNVFGIKADSGWTGPVCYADTSEHTSSGAIWINAGFRSYSSFQASFDDHASFFHENGRYANMLTMKNPFEIANELQHVTYATDWQYANKLKSIMMYDNLMSLDRDRGIDPSTGQPWNDIPYFGTNNLLPGGAPGNPPIPSQNTSTAPEEHKVNTSDSLTITFGIEQLYGTYAQYYESTENSSDFYNMVDPYTRKNIINMVDYNNVRPLYVEDTYPPKIYAKEIPDAISVTLESNSSNDLHVSRVNFVKGQY